MLLHRPGPGLEVRRRVALVPQAEVAPSRPWPRGGAALSAVGDHEGGIGRAEPRVGRPRRASSRVGTRRRTRRSGGSWARRSPRRSMSPGEIGRELEQDGGELRPEEARGVEEIAERLAHVAQAGEVGDALGRLQREAKRAPASRGPSPRPPSRWACGRRCSSPRRWRSAPRSRGASSRWGTCPGRTCPATPDSCSPRSRSESPWRPTFRL